MRVDKPALLVTAAALLTLASASFLYCPTARAAPPPSAAQTTAAPAYDDGDGDELLEHWGDPQYAREERTQIGGLSMMLAILGAGGWRRRQAQRKAVRHEKA